MKKLIIAAIIACCGYIAPFVTPLAQANIKLSASEQAALAETRFKSLILRATNANYWILNLKDFLHIGFSLKDYHKTDEQSAQAHSVFEIKSRSPLTGKQILPPLRLAFDSTIRYTPEMLENDQIAQVSSTYSLDPAGTANPRSDGLKALKNLLGYLSIETDLLKNDRVREKVTLRPFSMEDDKGKIDYAGLSTSAEYNQNDLHDILYDSTATLRSGRLRVTFDDTPAPAIDAPADDKEAPSATPAVITLEVAPFSGSLNTTKDSIKAKTSAIDIRFNRERKPLENFRIHADALMSEADNLVWDESIGSFLGTRRHTASGVRIDSAALPVSIGFKTLSTSSDVQKQHGRYDVLTRVHIVPDTDFAALFGVPAPKIGDLSLAVALERISGKALQTIKTIAIDEADEKELRITPNIATIITECVVHKTRGRVEFSLETAAGTITANAALGLKKGVDTASQEWQKALDALSENDEPAALKKLLIEHLEFKGKIVTPKAVISAFGAADLVKLIAGPYLKTEGDDYVIDFINDKIKLRVNGKPLPFVLP